MKTSRFACFMAISIATFLYSVLIVPETIDAQNSKSPNILVILAVDLGYGDLSCYNPESKVKTANLDRLAKEGMQFLDAHSPSTVCTPTRYSLLTGRMAFRNGMRGVFTGVGGPCLIEKDRLTLPAMLRKAGYRTACIGKWHVGMTFLDREGKPINRNGLEAVKRVDFSRASPDGPIHRGFDEFFGTVCCPTTDWLYAYMEGDRIPNPPTKLLDRAELPKHAYSRDNRCGMIADDFDLQRIDLEFLKRSQAFMRKQVKLNPDQPFFLFHSMQAVHLPSFAAKEYHGKSGAGPHGDFIFEMDDIVGQLMKTLEELKIADNTLVIFTSDNGPETTSVVNMRTAHQHDGARPWRGMKRDNWEGGHRVPLIVRWPGTVKANTRSEQMFCLTDIMATCASISGSKLPNDAAEDSFDFLSVLKGQAETPVREFLVHQTISLELAIRTANWKFLDHKGSGGNNYQKNRKLQKYVLPERAPEAPGQLYDLKKDPGETRNLYDDHPEVVEKLKKQIETIRLKRTAPLRKN